MKRLKIGISGGGLGGFAAAVALARDGHEVTIFEASAVLQEIGAGIQVPPNASKHLCSWGLGPFLERQAIYPDRLDIYRWQDGAPIGLLPLRPLGERFRGPYIQIKRSSLHNGLQEIAKELGVRVRTGCRVVDYNFKIPSLTLDDGEVVERDFIIAADGLRSIGRTKLVGHADHTMVETGYGAYRASLNMNDMKKVPEVAQLVKTPNQHAWIGPNRHIVTYTMLDDALFNLVLIHPWPAERPLRSCDADMKILRETYAGWDPRVQKLLEMIPAATAWPVMVAHRLENWSAQSGKFVLLGDAAHALPPNLAQGSAMAIEDAVVLSRLLKRTESLGDIPAAAKAYEKVRRERTFAVQDASTKNTALWHLEDGRDQRLRDEAAKRYLEDEKAANESPYIFNRPEGQQFLYGDHTEQT